LAHRGWSITFASRDPDGDLRDVVTSAGFQLIRVAGDEVGEIRLLRSALPERQDWLVLDSYVLGNAWLDHAKQLARHRAVIDDLQRFELDCDLFVHPTPLRGPASSASVAAPALIGPRYALLRSQFSRAHIEGGARVVGDVRSILVSLGGAVDGRITTSVAQACHLAVPEAEVVAVLGHQISDQEAGHDEPMVRYLARVEDMAALMLRVDMAVGAGGTTSWERCAVGLPSIIVAIADNQVPVGRTLTENGCAVYLGDLKSLEPRRLEEEIRLLAASRDRRSAMSSASRGLVDGLGVMRVAHHLDGVRIRRATMADASLLWRWANDPDTRAASFTSEPIPYPDHVRWLQERLADRSCLLLIGWNGAGPLGQVRFDRTEDEAEVSISVAPEHRGVVGSLLLESALQRFRHGSLRSNIVVARVKIDNERSRRLFERAGFRLVGEREGVLLYHASASADATS